MIQQPLSLDGSVVAHRTYRMVCIDSTRPRINTLVRAHALRELVNTGAGWIQQTNLQGRGHPLGIVYESTPRAALYRQTDIAQR